MKLYAKYPSVFYKFIPKSGRTDRFAFASLAKGDYVLDDEGNIYLVVNPGSLNPGFLESYRIIEVKRIAYNALPEQIKNTIYNLSTGYPQSSICKKALEVAQQG